MRAFKLMPVLAAGAILAALPMLAGSASAKTSSFMTECSAKWKAAKAAGSVPAGMKWPEFMKTQCVSASTDQNATTDTGATTDSGTSAGTTDSGTSTDTSAASTKTSGGSFMQQCSAAWSKLKSSNSVPAGLTWKQFVKQKCVVDGAAPADTANATPPEPQQSSSAAPMKPTQNWRTIEVAKADKNGKPFSPGQIAAHQRIKECAAEWHAAKADNTLPAGEKWPHFWSTCNTRLKAQN